MNSKYALRKLSEFIGTALLILSYIQFPILAQDDTSTDPPPALNAAKLTGTPPQIDGNLNETEKGVGLTGRFNFAFTPNLSLQLYAQPFVSSGHYSGFKQVADPKGKRYVDRFKPLKTETVSRGYEADQETLPRGNDHDNPRDP